MNEEKKVTSVRPGRKVLISIKVSTLLLIILAIILAVVLIKNVPKIVNSFTNEEKEKTSNYKQAYVVEEKNELSRPSVEISSRSLDVPRTESNVENVLLNEDISIDEKSETTEDSVVSDFVLEESNIDTQAIENSTVNSTVKIEDVTISKDMDLTQRTGLSREDFILLISNVKQDTSNFFEENAGLIFDICEKYQLNEIFFCGLIAAESGWNIASGHRSAHNYIGLMSGNGLIKFASVESGLENAAKTLHEKYLTPGTPFFYGTNLSAVKTKFCPASATWVNLVFGRMSDIVN